MFGTIYLVLAEVFVCGGRRKEKTAVWIVSSRSLLQDQPLGTRSRQLCYHNA